MSRTSKTPSTIRRTCRAALLPKAAALALALSAAALPVLSMPAKAHAPKVGHHGGPQANGGSYHVEIVPKDTVLDVYLRDHGDNPVATNGFKATALFVIDGKPQRIVLEPGGDNRLTGTSPVALPAEPKGAVQIIAPNGSTASARFD